MADPSSGPDLGGPPPARACQQNSARGNPYPGCGVKYCDVRQPCEHDGCVYGARRASARGAPRERACMSAYAPLHAPPWRSPLRQLGPVRPVKWDLARRRGGYYMAGPNAPMASRNSLSCCPPGTWLRTQPERTPRADCVLPRLSACSRV